MSDYKYVNVGGDILSEHRILWEEANGPIPSDLMIDHINGDTMDNRLDNLRLVTPLENNKNRKTQGNNTSGVNGVVYHKASGKWNAQVTVNRKRISLGLHADWFDAVCARMSANNLEGFHENHGRR